MNQPLRRQIARQIALAAFLGLALGLLHARALAEICIATIDVLFLAHLAQNRTQSSTESSTWNSLKQPWLLIALAWWGWEMLCSLPIPAMGLGISGWPGLVQAIVLIRLILLAAALQLWLFTTPAAQRYGWAVLALSCLWIGVESWQQLLTGHNIFGNPRWADGALTGPFWEPRAGAPYAHLLFAALLPVAIPLLARKQLGPRVAAIALAMAAMVTLILIGQRMPTALGFLALATCALFIRQLRPAALGAIILGGVIIAALPLISPPTAAKLIGETQKNLGHFALSPYGELYTRATTMLIASPLHGYGFNGFKTGCPSPAFATGLPALGIAPTTLALGACNIHPHNFYLQAATDGGIPGLILFASLNLAWLACLGRGLWRKADPLRTGLFAGVLTYAWPLASTDSFATLPHAGWLFIMVGLGLACTYISTPSISTSSSPD